MTNQQKLAALTLQTRRYGNCYVPVALRNTENNGEIQFSISSFGRSLQSGGHKYKVHARYAESGKPVPSKVLVNL